MQELFYIYLLIIYCTVIIDLSEKIQDRSKRTRTCDRVILVTESIRHWNTRCRVIEYLVEARVACGLHPRREEGRLGAARGGTELHCFSRRGNLLSALFTQVSSFSLHYHYTTNAYHYTIVTVPSPLLQPSSLIVHRTTRPLLLSSA